MERPHLSSGMAKGKWDSNKFRFEKDHSSGTSPPGKLYYACSFCNRAFSCAQALGGHMNVHRWDRALLAMTLAVCDCHEPYLDSNPNTKFSSSTSFSPAKFLLDTHQPLPSLSSPSSASTYTGKKAATNLPKLHPLRSPDRDVRGKKRIRGVLGFGESESTEQKDEPRVLEKEDTVNLDSETGFLKDPKEDLDLELRLGCF